MLSERKPGCILYGTDCVQALLARNYRGDIPMSAVEKFPILLSEAEEESSAVPPCFSHEGINVRSVTPPIPLLFIPTNKPAVPVYSP